MIQPDHAMDVVKAKAELQEPVLAVKLAGSKEIANESDENTETAS